MICEKGPRYGYFPKPEKSYLVVKPDKMEEAKIFKRTGVHVVLDAQRDLGAVIGIESAVNAKLRAKVSEWASQVEKLAEITSKPPITNSLVGCPYMLFSAVLSEGQM